jgi:hypothetical protein
MSTEHAPPADECIRFEDSIYVRESVFPAHWLDTATRVVRADEVERLRQFAFGDAPEWEKANATLKHRVRELEARLAFDEDRDD